MSSEGLLPQDEATTGVHCPIHYEKDKIPCCSGRYDKSSQESGLESCESEHESDAATDRRRLMHDILPSSNYPARQSSIDARSADSPVDGQDEEDTTWRNGDRVGASQIHVDPCFSRRPHYVQQRMIDLDRTSVSIIPPLIRKKDFNKMRENARENTLNSAASRSDADLSENSIDYAESPAESNINAEDSSFDHVRSADQIIIKVDPRTPSPIPSPPCEDNEDEKRWTNDEPLSPNSVIIKVEPRTPSPITEITTESQYDSKNDKKGK
eukprot:gene17778-19554_t